MTSLISPSRLHLQFLASPGQTEESLDRSNKLLDAETQLGWLRGIGFEDVDCHWNLAGADFARRREASSLSRASANFSGGAGGELRTEPRRLRRKR